MHVSTGSRRPPPPTFATSAAISAGAITVRTRPGDILMEHAALDLATEGDDIVVDAGGDLTRGLRRTHTTTAQRKGVGRIVISGAVRDSPAVRVAPTCLGGTIAGPTN
ncbi:RraA family protein [Nakamurella sp. GG22]